jgi:hypothetical protein
MTEIRVTSYCECPFSDAIEFAQRALKNEPRMQVSPVSLVSENVSQATKLVDDATDTSRIHDALLLAWKPDHQATFPDFRGLLTVRPRDRGVWMRLQGTYNPPFGLAGKVFDAVAGKRIAQLTLRRLLDRVIEDVEVSWTLARH